MAELIGALMVLIFARTEANLHSELVSMQRLPLECRAVYQDLPHEVFQAPPVREIRQSELDLDGDAVPEKILYNGRNGSGGEGWTVLRHDGRQWRRCGEVFGLLSTVHVAGHRYLVVCSPLGARSADWTCYKLQKGKLQRCLNLAVEYAQAVRKKPTEIRISLNEQKKEQKSDIEK